MPSLIFLEETLKRQGQEPAKEWGITEKKEAKKARVLLRRSV